MMLFAVVHNALAVYIEVGGSIGAAILVGIIGRFIIKEEKEEHERCDK